MKWSFTKLHRNEVLWTFNRIKFRNILSGLRFGKFSSNKDFDEEMWIMVNAKYERKGEQKIREERYWMNTIPYLRYSTKKTPKGDQQIFKFLFYNLCEVLLKFPREENFALAVC